MKNIDQINTGMLRTDIISLPNNCALFTAHRKLFKNIFEADIEH